MPFALNALTQLHLNQPSHNNLLPILNPLPNPMKHLTLSLLAFISLAVSARADKLDDWNKLLPKNTIGTISIKNTQELLADWDKSSVARMMSDEEFKKWTAPMRKDGEAPWDKHFREQSGQGFYDTIKIYPGATMLVIAADGPDSFKDEQEPGCTLSEAGDKQKELEELKGRETEGNKKEHPDLKQRTEEIAGVTVNIVAESDAADAKWIDAWAFVDGTFIEGSSRKLMEHFITAIKSGAAESSDVVAGHLKRIAPLTEGTTDVMIYLNGVALTKWAEDAATQAAAKAKEGPGAAMMPFDPAQMFGAFGVKELEALAITFDLTDEQSRGDVVILHPEKPAGLLSIMRGSSTDVSFPALIPADVSGGGVSRYSMEGMWDGLLAMVQKLGPMAMMAAGQLGMAEQQLGFKFKEDLFGAIADEMIQASDGGAEDASQVIGFKVKDRNRLGGALDSIKKIAGQGFGAFEESEYLGHKIDTLKTSMTGAAPTGAGNPKSPEIAICLTDSYLLISIGKQELLKKLLARMKDPSGPSIWDDPRAQALIAKLPKGYCGAGVTDGSAMIAGFFEGLSNMQNATGIGKKSAAKKGPGKGPGKGAAAKKDEDGNDAPKGWLDPKAKPSENFFKSFFGSSVSGSYCPPDAIHMRLLSAPVDGQ